MPTDVDHPRPFLQRPWLSLDGVWEFALDRERRIDDPTTPAFDDTIVVPFAPETPAASVRSDGRGVDGYVQRCWYRRTVDVDPPADGERVLVHFSGVDRIADVWANGAHVGHHVGGYSAFEVDVTQACQNGRLVLVVRADDDGHDLEVPRGKQDWQPTSHSIFYPRTTGIWKSVWLERVGSNRIGALRWTTNAEAMTVACHATVVGIDGPVATNGLRLGIRLLHDGDVLVDDVVSVTGRGATATIDRVFTVGTGSFDDRFALTWWPTRPTIIEAELTLLDDDERPLDRVDSYTAIRSVEVSHGQLRLNGRPYPLRMVLDQGYWPASGATPTDIEALRRDIELTKALGFNGARKHQKTEDPRYFALADRLGLLTWVEMPSAHRHGPRASANVLREWAEIVAAHRDHPSVIAWVPINESWGVADCEHDRSQRALIEALRDTTNALDGTRPVSANDGWETVGGDIVGVHDYDQDTDALTTRWGDRAAVDSVIASRRPDGRPVDLDHAPAAQRAVVLSEFGGIAMAVDTDGSAFSLGTENWGYDVASSPDDFLARYREQWAVVHASTALVGGCWTQLTDTYQEVNGLLTADRRPKADLAQLAAATRGKAPPR